MKNRESKKFGIKKILFTCAIAGFSLFIIAVLFAGWGLYILNRDLPSISSLKDYRPSIITRVYADKNDLIDQFYLEDRKLIQATDLPRFVIQAFVAAEDARFFHHGGVDIQSIVRAFLKNLKAGTIVQGGSTITQQVAKSLFLTPEKSYLRKLKEAMLAYKIERYLDKYEILNLYLNQIYLGHGAYGIEAASQRYFGKQAKELKLAQAALLAGLPKAPSKYSPFYHFDLARNRQIYVLERMAIDGYITEKEQKEAIEEVLALKETGQTEKIAPYFTENVRRYIQSTYSTDVLYREGLEVHTTLDVEMQKAARDAVKRGLRELDKRQGYRGPVDHIPLDRFDSYLETAALEQKGRSYEKGEMVRALVVGVETDGVSLRVGNLRASMALKDMDWARKPDPKTAYKASPVEDAKEVLKTGDVIEASVLEIKKDVKGSFPFLVLALEQEPEVQGALVCLDARTGEIKAMVGGRSYGKSEFNRATQAKRQPGSAFKPFIYTAAFDKGMTPSTIIMDSPIIFRDTLKDSPWKPHNYEETFYGPTMLRTALIKSRNLVTIKVLKDIGIDYAADYARNMGISSPLAHDLSMALGSSAVTLLEMVKAYGTIANSGKRAEPFSIKKIIARNGTILEETRPKTAQVIDPQIAYITCYLLQEVVEHGTGWRVKALKRPVAGKTGTTNDLFDAWFIGFTPSLVTGVWVGYDDLKPLGRHETGSRAASPVFLYFMEKVLESEPEESFAPPEGIVFANIDPETGMSVKKKLPNSVVQCFVEGTEPFEENEKEDYAESNKRGSRKLDLDSFMKSERQEFAN